MKTYYIRYGDFGNEYDLAWADNKDDGKYLIRNGFERVPRKYAESRARAERWRRQVDQAFSGYADDDIKPAKYWILYEHKEASGWLLEEDPLMLLYNKYKLKGVIWE